MDLATDEIVKEFLIESNEGLDRLDHDLVELEKNPKSADLLGSIFRAIHTVKGTGGVLGFLKIEKVAHAGENLLSRMRDGQLTLNSDITTALLSMVDTLRNMLDKIAQTGTDGENEFPELIASLGALLPPPDCSVGTQASVTAMATPHDRPGDSRKLGQILIAREQVQPEAVLEALDDQAGGDTRKLGEILVAKGDTMPVAVANAVDAQAEAHAHIASSNVRVDVNLLDKLMNLVGELVLTRNQILQFTNGSDNSYGSATQRLNLITTELQEGVMKTRMQPIGNVWNKFPRLVRDLAVSCNKEVRIELDGTRQDHYRGNQRPAYSHNPQLHRPWNRSARDANRKRKTG
jgi:two-component system chemotaxis sensor kinase CheA